MIAVAPRVGLVDRPGERRIHTAEIPRAGGIAVWLAFLAAGFLALEVFPGPGGFTWEWFRAFAFSSGILMAIGIIDDRYGITAWQKLAGQLAVAVLLFFAQGGGVGMFVGVDVPWWLDLAIWTVWMLAIVNAFNLIDGLDGLCAGLAVISVSALAALTFFAGRTGDALVMLAMLGALLGFLRFNFHPARI